MRDLLWVSCLLTGTILPAILLGQETPTAKNANTTTEQMATWIQDLSAEQFVTRETATLKIIDVGSAAITPLVQALPQSNPEATARIIHILRQLALNEEWTVDDPALQALQKIAKQKGTSAGRRATATLSKLSAMREQRAIQELTLLGAEVKQVAIQFGLQLVPQRVIHIGDEWKGTTNDLKRLKWISSAEAVEIIGDKASDSWLPHLVGMQQLRSLTIKRAKVTDKGIKNVAELTSLVSLDIKYTPITDASLAHMQNLPQIRFVKLYGTDVSKEAADKLQNALAAAEVDHRNGAFLGVGCPQPPEPCIITSIQSNSAAQKAGLRTGDWIVSFSGEPVVDFNDLKKLIGKWRPGDKTTLQVMRINAPKFGNLRKAEDTKADFAATKHPLGLKLTKLEETSPWYKAGLRVDDVIHKIDGERILDAAFLKKELDASTNGELLQLIYYRNPRLQEYDVELGEWE